MEVVLMVKDAFGELLSICDTLEAADEMAAGWQEMGMETVVSRGVIHEADTLAYSKNFGLYDVYEVKNRSGDSFYCRSRGLSEALAEAAFFWFDYFEPQWVRMYDAEELSSREVFPHKEETYEVTQLTRNVLRELYQANRDLCVLAMDYTNEVESEEELLDLEISMHTPWEEKPSAHYEKQRMRYIPVEAQTAEGIRQTARSVWYEWTFMESTDPSPEILAWMEEGKASDDVTDTLVRTFILQCWGGYECRYPYALYRGIMERRFDPWCEKHEEIRRIFDR